jgi:hypothetical protein
VGGGRRRAGQGRAEGLTQRGLQQCGGVSSLKQSRDPPGPRSTRLSLPLLRTAHLLITSAGLGGARVPAPAEPGAAPAVPADVACDPAAVPFAVAALRLARAELRGCADVPRLLEGAALIAAAAGAGPAAAYGALQSALALLVSRFPRVRRAAAEQLYLTLLAADGGELESDDAGDPGDSGGFGGGGGGGPAAAGAALAPEAGPPGWALPGGEAGLEEALDLLLASPWDGPLDGAREARNALAALLRVEVRAAGRGGGGAGGGGGAAAAAAAKKAAAAAAAARDDYLSYQSLLDDAARGGGY